MITTEQTQLIEGGALLHLNKRPSTVIFELGKDINVCSVKSLEGD